MTRFRVTVLSLAGLVLLVVAFNKLGPLVISGDWFTAVVGWANILAAFLAVLVPVALLSPAFDSADSAATRLEAERNELLKTIRRGEGSALNRLIAVDQPAETRALDLRFSRSMLKYRSAGGAPSGSLVGVLGYFDSLRPKRLVVLGEAGSGKTVLALELMRQLLADAARASTDPIPVRFPLGSFDNESTLEEWLIAVLVSAYQLRPRSAENLVKNGEILPVLDGLDEMDSDPLSLTRANRVVRLVNDYLYGGQASPIIITCRTNAYASLDRGVRDATEIVLNAIDASTCLDYLKMQYENPIEELSWVNVVEGLRGSFGLAVVSSLITTLSTPWRISAAISACRSGQINPDDIFFSTPPSVTLAPIPRSSNDARLGILRTFVAVRLKIVANRAGIVYREQSLMGWLRYAAVYVREQTAAGRPRDIRLENWWMARRRTALSLHVSLVVLISIVGFWLFYEALGGADVLNLTLLEIYWRRPQDLDPAFAYGGIIVVGSGGLAVISGVVLAMQSRITPNRVSFQALRRSSGLAMVFTGLAIGAVVGAFIGGGVGLAGGLSLDSGRSLLVGLIGGSAAGIILGISRAVGRARSDRDGPASAVTDDAYYGAALGITLGVLVAVGGTISIGLRFGVLTGTVVLAWCVLVVCSRVAVRYALTVIVLALPPTCMPIRFGRMLAWSADAGLLRRIGATYQFRHDELQNAFASGSI